MNFKNPYWSARERITLLQRWILMHSIIYYELNENIVTDAKFDLNCRELMKLKAEYPKDYSESTYISIFIDFDGATGFDLFRRLNSVQQHKFMGEARWVIYESNKRKERG